MYRIELRAGEEAIYKTFDEFAKAVRTGSVNLHARIWHTASGKWLPISFHPHFKRAQASTAEAPAPASPEPKKAPAPKPPEPPSAPRTPAPTPAPAPLPPAARTTDLEFLELPPAPAPMRRRSVPGSLFGPAPAATPRHIEALVAAADAAPAPVLPPAPAPVSSPAVHAPVVSPSEEPAEILIDISRPRPRFLQPRVLGVAAGLALLASAGVYLISHKSAAAPESGESTQMASTSLAATPRTSFEAAAVEPATQQPDSASSAPAGGPVMYMAMPDIPKGPSADDLARMHADSGAVLPAAPRLGKLTGGPATGSGGSSPAMLAARYNSAHDGAEAALATRLRASGISALFSEARLGAGQVSDTRLAVAGIANFIRSFRKQATVIDRAYQDTAAQSGARWSDADRSHWQSLTNRVETPAQARAADQLLGDISSLLGVLEEQQGAYTITGSTVTFQDAGATLRYGTLRRRVSEALDAGDSTSAVAAALHQVIGSKRPPTERYTE